MKKILLSISIYLLIAMMPTVVVADGTTRVEKVCTTNQYGQETCSEKTIREEVVHEPVDAAIGDVNPILLLIALFGGGYLTLIASRKLGQI